MRSLRFSSRSAVLRTAAIVGLGLGVAAAPAAAQNFATDNAVLRQIWDEGMNRSQLYPLAQALLDSIGPRLTGSPGQKAANDWAVAKYAEWGIPARNEQYGTWTGWRRGTTHIDLVEPRVASLEGTMLAWSPGTNGPVTGKVVALPTIKSAADFEAWLPQVKGAYVAISFPQPTCRPDENWEKWATAASFEKMKKDRDAALQAWNASLAATGVSPRELPKRLEQAGAAGVLTSLWSQGWGVDKIFNARTERVPTVDLSCEDYGMVARLAQNNQNPVLRIDAKSESLGKQPTYNTIAEIRGKQKPNEYVVLSAHFDSWDGSTGATDNGTGTVTMMEAMRILKKYYPNPKRTILVGHWSGEEQGLNGSRAFMEDNPKVVKGMQALFNQDNGTGRVTNISMQGFTQAGSYFGKWLSQIPSEITQHIELQMPGFPGGGGSDHASFVCAGAPAFMLSSLSWDYGTYTWHTNRDSFDKIVFDDVKNNAVLIAMLAYLASEEPQLMPRDKRTVLPNNPRTGEPMTWPTCTPATRDAALSTR